MGSSPYSALTEPAWRHLLAQSVLMHAVAERLADLHDAALTPGPARMALESLPPQCALAATRSASDLAAITDATALWSDSLDASIATASGHQSLPLLQAVRAKLGPLACVDHFARLFSEVTLRAADVYGDRWLQPRLELAWLKAHPRRGGDPYALEALTKPGSPPVVELLIHPTGFGPAAWAALPYVLVHEAIAHVPARPIGEVSNDNAFNEGFMDWVARYLLIAWMPGIDRPLAPAAIEHASRIDPVVTDPALPRGAFRLYGRRAAEKLASWLVDERGRSVFEAQAAVAVLGRDLNCVDCRLDLKHAFVVAVNDDPWPAGFEGKVANVIDGSASPTTLF